MTAVREPDDVDLDDLRFCLGDMRADIFRSESDGKTPTFVALEVQAAGMLAAYIEARLAGDTRSARSMGRMLELMLGRPLSDWVDDKIGRSKARNSGASIGD